MQSHVIDYELYGSEMQLVEVELDPEEAVIAEAGSMNYFETGIQFDTKLGDGSNPDQGMLSKIFSAGSRWVMGESLFLTHFTNRSGKKLKVAFSAPYPGKIIPVDLSNHQGSVVCQNDAFLCAAMGTKVSIEFTKRLRAGLLGGEGFVLERISGEGLAFIHAGGTVIEKELNNDKIHLDTGCLVGFSGNIDYSIEAAPNLKSMFFGGEGLFLATLQGTGKVWIQSLPFSRLADRIIQSAPQQGGQSVGEHQGILGFLSRFLDNR